MTTLESILNLAKTGRRAVLNGDLAAAIANRRSVLKQLDAMHPNAELSASVRALQAAERYALHADTTCGLRCPSSTNERATQLKRAFVASFNPIATRYGTPTYSPAEI